MNTCLELKNDFKIRTKKNSREFSQFIPKCDLQWHVLRTVAQRNVKSKVISAIHQAIPKCTVQKGKKKICLSISVHALCNKIKFKKANEYNVI